MNKRNWRLLLMIALCLVAFFGYRWLRGQQTDNVAPVITVEQTPLELSVTEDKSVLLRGVSAMDDTDGDVTASIVVESIHLQSGDGTAQVGYAAFDSAGNVAKIQRQVRYTDYERPKFTLNGPLLYPSGQNFDILSTVGAVDSIDGDIQHRIRATVEDEASVSAVGTYSVRFQVTNSMGDTVTQSFPVEVYDAGAYDAGLTLTDYLIYLPSGAQFRAEEYLDSFILRGESKSLRNGLPENYQLSVSGTVQTRTPGTYVVEYRVTRIDHDAAGQYMDREYTGYSKLIVVVEE